MVLWNNLHGCMFVHHVRALQSPVYRQPAYGQLSGNGVISVVLVCFGSLVLGGSQTHRHSHPDQNSLVNSVWNPCRGCHNTRLRRKLEKPLQSTRVETARNGFQQNDN